MEHGHGTRADADTAAAAAAGGGNDDAEHTTTLVSGTGIYRGDTATLDTPPLAHTARHGPRPNGTTRHATARHGHDSRHSEAAALLLVAVMMMT